MRATCVTHTHTHTDTHMHTHTHMHTLTQSTIRWHLQRIFMHETDRQTQICNYLHSRHTDTHRHTQTHTHTHTHRERETHAHADTSHTLFSDGLVWLSPLAGGIFVTGISPGRGGVVEDCGNVCGASSKPKHTNTHTHTHTRTHTPGRDPRAPYFAEATQTGRSRQNIHTHIHTDRVGRG